MAEKNPTQISCFTNNKAVVELINKLKPATPGKGSHLHRSGEKDANGRSLPNSMIGINLVDYEKNPSVFVQENLTPAQVKELYQEAIMKRGNYNFSGNGQKIFGNPDENGYSIVRTLKINRQGAFLQNGKTIIKNYPWTITIQNGKGIKEVQATGGTSCKKGSFVLEKEAKILMSDGSFFALFEEANLYLTAWENYVAHSFIKANEEAIQVEEENRRIAWLQRREQHSKESAEKNDGFVQTEHGCAKIMF